MFLTGETLLQWAGASKPAKSFQGHFGAFTPPGVARVWVKCPKRSSQRLSQCGQGLLGALMHEPVAAGQQGLAGIQG